jgi:glucose-6-phosphate dehydrogenase assembly protein OpcA
MQIQLEKTLDIAIVERHFAELWKQTTGKQSSEDEVALLRARVANLLVYASRESLLHEVDQMMAELTAIHPGRVLMMLGDKQAADRDIEMFVATFCQTDRRTGQKRLCGEQVILKAQGKFVGELPSAALPLLVSDLSTFLWWRDSLQLSDDILKKLLRATDRLIIDSADFQNSQSTLLEINKLFRQEDYKHVGISDLNWARLTLWRAMLADFYDVPAYQPWLDQINHARIDYVAPEHEPMTVAPQAFLVAGWLASRLGWNFLNERFEENQSAVSFKFAERKNRVITLELNRVERGERKPGRLVKIELRSDSETPVSFSVSRSADNLHLVTEARLGTKVQRGRVLPVRNRSAAQLLTREMEILCNDRIYQEALEVASNL